MQMHDEFGVTEERDMRNCCSKSSRVVFRSLLILTMLTVGTLPGFARNKYETIDAQAFGTGTQLGANIGITIIIYDYSTAADRQVLIDAFTKGQNRGLVNALSK